MSSWRLPIALRYPAVLLFSVYCFLAGPVTNADTLDLLLQGGRVIDPDSGLDGIRHIGIRGGKIISVSPDPSPARQVLNVSGLVVAPGFIDLHAHGQNNLANDYQARDGVTTALELEMGVMPVKAWYDSREQQAIINFGASVSHAIGRSLALDNLPTDTRLDLFRDALGPSYSNREMDDPSLARLHSILKQGIADGGLGIGIGLAYIPGARRKEIYRVYQSAAGASVPVFVHARLTSVLEPDSTSALQELIANSASSGAATHLCHIGSAGGVQVPVMLEMIDGARRHGIDISTEVYPYTAAHTFIGAAIFNGAWRRNIGMTYHDLQWTLTGERLTESSFNRYRREQPEGSVVAYFMPESIVDSAVAHPGVIIASDGGRWENNAGHPRGAGTFSRILGRYVREKKLLDLPEALAKMTILPARRLQSFVPAMLYKGRISAGADADLTIFDAQTIIDRATYEQAMQYSEGIQHVLVNGVFVVRDGKSIDKVFPGKAIKTAVSGMSTP